MGYVRRAAGPSDDNLAARTSVVTAEPCVVRVWTGAEIRGMWARVRYVDVHVCMLCRCFGAAWRCTDVP